MRQAALDKVNQPVAIVRVLAQERRGAPLPEIPWAADHTAPPARRPNARERAGHPRRVVSIRTQEEHTTRLSRYRQIVRGSGTLSWHISPSIVVFSIISIYEKQILPSIIGYFAQAAKA